MKKHGSSNKKHALYSKTRVVLAPREGSRRRKEAAGLRRKAAQGIFVFLIDLKNEPPVVFGILDPLERRADLYKVHALHTMA